MVRHRIAVIALAAIALSSTIANLLDLITLSSATQGMFGVPAFETRFDVLRRFVKPHEVFGYVSDNPAGQQASQAEFYLTQYTLVPALINASTEERLEVGNMHNQPKEQQALDAELAARHLVPVQDYGNGVKMYRNNLAK